MEREFFASHTVSELRSWSDYALEAEGRLVEPMAYDAVTDTYVPIAWADAFALVGETLRVRSAPGLRQLAGGIRHRIASSRLACKARDGAARRGGDAGQPRCRGWATRVSSKWASRRRAARDR